jgi:P4 family phage/plasmid primase-like protien
MNARELFKLGYTDVISVVPPGAKLSPNSKLKADQLGKTPGKRNQQAGDWYGYNWQKAAPATLRDVAQWDADGANVGLRAGAFPAVDIDCTDAQLVEVIRSLAIQHLGIAPERQGRAPKSLLMYRTAAPFGRMRLWIDGRKHLVEILGDGQQFVLSGIHPGTQKPYSWRSPIVEASALNEITSEAADAFLVELAATLDLLGYTTQREGNGSLSVDRDGINQGDLSAADLDKLAAAVAAMPNDNAHFSGRDDYLRVGYAIKAAAGDAGYGMFEAWALKWEGNENYAGNDADTVRADWDRMQPPYEVGANYIFDAAREFGHVPADEFEAIDPPAEGDEPESTTAGVQYSDGALAARFLKKHGHELRFCAALGGWLVWTGKQWARDESQTVHHWAGKIGAAASAEALITIEEKGTANKVATRCASLNSMIAVARYASSNPAVFSQVAEFDSNPLLLNTPGGIVDLETGLVRPHSPGQMMTKTTLVAPADRPAPLWQAFLHEATGGDRELIAYLQRLAGYALTGLTSEHTLAFFHGGGGNGKGTFLNALQKIWKDYATVTPMNTFMSSNTEQHPTSIAALAGARLVTAQENNKARTWDEAKVKSLTGGDPITARFMAKDFFTYQPQFKLLFSGNHKPTITNLDAAMRRRFHLVPFTVTPKRIDKQLDAKLVAEYPAILNWAIEGAIEWQKTGLVPPRAVVDATAEYFEDADPAGSWVRERTEPAPGEFINSNALYTDWVEYCGMTGEKPGSQKAFVQTLQQRGYERKKQGGTGLRGFVGLRLAYPLGSEFGAA